ncbi:hypothetical protein LTS17_011416 [Exophiala oligosperma]
MDRKSFIDLIDSEQDEHVKLLQAFVRAPSTNPPGDTLEAANVLREYLERQGVPVGVIAPQGASKPNLVEDFACGEDDDGDSSGNGGGRRVVMNGHIDVFPVDESRGEAGGRLGSRWLLGNDGDRDRWEGGRHDRRGTGRSTVGEVRRKGHAPRDLHRHDKGTAHGAYTHVSEGGEPGGFEARRPGRSRSRRTSNPDLDRSIVDHMGPAGGEGPRLDEITGKGASEDMLRPTVNVGVMRGGGIKVNMIPDRCAVEVDVVLRYVDGVLDRRGFKDQARGVKVEYAVQEAASNPSSHGAVDHEMIARLAGAGEEVTGRESLAVPGLGATDAKFWRSHGVPAFVYGVGPRTMAAAVDDRVGVDEFVSVVKVHAAAVWDYLGGAQ